ncbi:hypothetical protein [Methylovirgula sp. HY1]|uniref:hypothetical protein n=1 Tax=Methylovirgula sp. HY1 TaxID=2822761 RepID=UPI001C5AD6E2|nr:hypothetical protein [Methylovirgula sp. HY1]QXX75350.1 hypothetical protein MHY1_02169 [Methylovirgula sp. HY1]
MADPQIVTTLRSKRDDLERIIKAYEGKIKAAQHDLMHVNATLRLFELNGAHEVFPVHADVTRLFRRGEMVRLCKDALAGAPEGLDTRELARAVIIAKGLDAEDAVLRKAVAYRIVQALTGQWQRGGLTSGGKRQGVRVWRC